ncbi:MAG: T9SS type A sorting domain-containing protein [Bacteroidota bacterium]
MTGVRENQKQAPTHYSLEQNYPNPFNPSTVITFSVGTYGHTSLRVYDMLGREVATLINQEISAGTYNVKFDASKLSSGVYFYRLVSNAVSSGSSDSYILTKKMILIK